MRVEAPQDAITAQVPEGFSLRVTFEGAGGQLFVQDQPYRVNKAGLLVSEDDQQSRNLVERALVVSKRLQDGTVVLSVDLGKNEALFVSPEIFGGQAKLNNQDDVVKDANRRKWHGHNDWRLMTNYEVHTLLENWGNVTTKVPDEWFWTRETYYGNPLMYRSSPEDWGAGDPWIPHQVPLVRVGPAYYNEENLVERLAEIAIPPIKRFETKEQKPVTVQVPEGFRLYVHFNRAGGQLFIENQAYRVNETGIVVPGNDQQSRKLAQRTFVVGETLRDGTVVLSVDVAINNEALFVPAKIFGGVAEFAHQNDVVRAVNTGNWHGHSDWRRITDIEGDMLQKSWEKVTKRTPQQFWLPSCGRKSFLDHGYTRCAGDETWYGKHRLKYHPLPVPVIRSGPARYVEAELT